MPLGQGSERATLTSKMSLVTDKQRDANTSGSLCVRDNDTLKWLLRSVGNKFMLQKIRYSGLGKRDL